MRSTETRISSPKTYELEYRDEAGVWHPVENTTEYVVVKDGFSNLKFNPVVATGIRLTMTPSKDGSAIMKWKVYGWGEQCDPSARRTGNRRSP